MIIATEIWKDVVGYEGYYQVSSCGNVKSLHFGYEYILSSRPIADGYLRVSLSVNGIAKDKLVHVAVAEAFIGPVPLGQEVNHIDLNKINNRADNLEYKTHLENIRHAISAGVITTHFGTDNGNSKFTDETIDAFLYEHSVGNSSVKDLMHKYGIQSKSYAYALIRGDFRRRVA